MPDERKPLPYCQRCEDNERGVIFHPPLGLCHRCLFGMPEEEFEEMAREWEEQGLIPREESR